MRIFFILFSYIFSTSLFAEEPAGTNYEFSSQMSSIAGSFVTIIFVLILIVFLLKKIMQAKLQTANNLNQIKILEKRPLNQKTSLYIVEVNEIQFLISESQAGVHTICQLPKTEKSVDEKVDCKETTTFASILSSKLKIPSLRSSK